MCFCSYEEEGRGNELSLLRCRCMSFINKSQSLYHVSLYLLLDRSRCRRHMYVSCQSTYLLIDLLPAPIPIPIHSINQAANQANPKSSVFWLVLFWIHSITFDLRKKALLSVASSAAISPSNASSCIGQLRLRWFWYRWGLQTAMHLFGTLQHLSSRRQCRGRSSIYDVSHANQLISDQTFKY